MADSTPKTGKQKAANTFVWIIVLLLIAALAGFGATSFGTSATAIADVGQREVSVNTYYNTARAALDRESRLQGRRLRPDELRTVTVLDETRQELVRNAAVENEALRIGLSIGDDLVAQQVETFQEFQGIDGRFDREVFEASLRRNGLSAKDFLEDVRLQSARQLMRGGIQGGTEVPVFYGDAIERFFGESRDFRFVRFSGEALESEAKEPTEADLASYHEENAAAFTLPDRRRITYILLTPDDVADQVEIPEDAIRNVYNQRIDQYRQPERRLVERLVFDDMPMAQAAADRIEAAEISFDELVEERGLTLEDADLGTVSREDLEEAAEVVFALESPGIAGPVTTNLGPALFRVNAVLEAQETPFEDVQEILRQELATASARQEVISQTDTIEDLLASGATLEEVAAETDMSLDTIDYHGQVREGPALYAAFRRAAAELSADAFPQLLPLEDGGLFALRLDAELPSELQPLEDVRDDVVRGWQQQELRAALREEAEVLNAQMAVGADIGSGDAEVFSEQARTRDAILPDTPPNLVFEVFNIDEVGNTTILEDVEDVYLVVLDAINDPDAEDERIQSIRAQLTQQASITLADDVMLLFGTAVAAETSISYNTRAIQAVHAELP